MQAKPFSVKACRKLAEMVFQDGRQLVEAEEGVGARAPGGGHLEVQLVGEGMACKGGL